MENQAKTKKTNNEIKRKGKVRRIINNIIIIVLVFILLGGVSIFFMLNNIISKASDKEAGLKDKIVNSEPTAVVAADGEKIYELGAESREIVTYAQIPQVTIDAFLAIEDSRFFKHNGFDLPRFISSALTNLKQGSLAQGGSTLTMQTIDNFIIKPKEEADELAGIKYSQKEKIELKIQEIYLSMRLENKMNKEEIITAYLNKINFGSSARGIQRGAEYYFGKNVEQLNLSESAFLAGVINAPNTYNPYIGYDEKKQINFYPYAMERRNETLDQMLNHGFISETEYTLAKSTELAFQVNGAPTSGDNPYEAYAKAAIQEAQNVTGVDPATTPMTIHTGLDKDMQKVVNTVGTTDVIPMPKHDYFQFASVVIGNNTGVVSAIHDGINTEEIYRSRAVKDEHAPGSTMKPFLDYAPTFDELGWCTTRTLEDKAIMMDTTVPVVNYDQKFHGTVNLATAIGQSYNTPAIQALQAVKNKIGRDGYVEYLKKLGFSDDIAEDFNEQYGLGASNMITTPMHMSAIYAAMANGGVYIEPHLVTKIEFHDGSKTTEIQPKKTQVMSPQAAYMISDLLYQAANGPTGVQNFYMGQAFNGVKYPVYGKTGTSDWGTKEDVEKFGGSMKDNWMINYTSEYTIATWTGFDGGIAGKNTNISQAILNMNTPGKINRLILDTISQNPVKLTRPDGLSSYAGGLIKSEYLNSAAKNNPNVFTQNTSALKTAVDNAGAMDSNKYTPESFAAVTNALKTARDVLNRSGSQEEIDNALAALNSAVNKLVAVNDKPDKPETPKTDKAALNGAISSSGAYMDKNQYNPTFVDALNTAVNNGKAIQNNANATQAQIDAAYEAINIAITNCKNNPVTPAVPPEGQ